MPNRLPLVLVALLGLCVVSAVPAGAQLGSDGLGGSGQHSLQLTTTSDFGPAVGVDFNLWTRFRVDAMSTFSWGRGTMGGPGWLRSSIAVLRERRGLMLR